MKRREQVVVSQSDTHASVINKDHSTECLFCAVKITIDYILWDCKETEITWLQINIAKEIWKGGKEQMEKLLLYVKEIGLYIGI
jgi:hypothetical protein